MSSLTRRKGIIGEERDRALSSANRADIDGLLKGKLSDILTPAHQPTKIKNLLSVMVRKDKPIQNAGSRTKPDWRLT